MPDEFSQTDAIATDDERERSDAAAAGRVSTVVGVRFDVETAELIDELRGFEPRASFVRRIVLFGLGMELERAKRHAEVLAVTGASQRQEGNDG